MKIALIFRIGEIKEQPFEYCLSTMESTLKLLELLNQDEIEKIDNDSFEKFLNPFHKMIEYQLNFVDNPRIK